MLISAACDTAQCPSVCLSVRPSLYHLFVFSHFFSFTILVFASEIFVQKLRRGRRMQAGYEHLRPMSHFISEMIQDIVVVILERQ